MTVYKRWLTGLRRGRFHRVGVACVYAEKSAIRKRAMLRTAAGAISGCALRRALT